MAGEVTGIVEGFLTPSIHAGVLGLRGSTLYTAQCACNPSHMAPSRE